MNFAEVWHQAYALGARIVFWPSMMSTPDRDTVTMARAFRYNVVANGSPGNILDTTGRPVNDTKVVAVGLAKNASANVVTGTIDLDADWVHQNGPGAIICPAVKKMCANWPGVFFFAIGGCGGPPKNPGCTAAPQLPGEDTVGNAVFLLQSKDKVIRGW